jgi:hypothetical protein
VNDACLPEIANYPWMLEIPIQVGILDGIITGNNHVVDALSEKKSLLSPLIDQTLPHIDLFAHKIIWQQSEKSTSPNSKKSGSITFLSLVPGLLERHQQ